MSRAKNTVRPVLTVALLGLTVLGLVNVYGDNREVQAQAATIACGGHECSTQLTRLDRSPIAQTYDFVAAPEGAKRPSRTVTVRCQPQYLMVGRWICTSQ